MASAECQCVKVALHVSSRHPQKPPGALGPQTPRPCPRAACRACEAGCLVIDPGGVTLGQEPLLLVALAPSACGKCPVPG